MDDKCIQIYKITDLEFHKLFILRCYLTSNKVKSQKKRMKIMIRIIVIFVNAKMQTQAYIHICACTFVNPLKYTHTYTHTLTHIHTLTRTHRSTHSYTHKDTHIHTRIHAPKEVIFRQSKGPYLIKREIDAPSLKVLSYVS
jgi:hypothetical protein